MKNHDCFIKIAGRTYYSWDSKNPSDWCAAGYKEGMEPTATHTGDWVQDPNSRFDNIMVNIQQIAGVEPVEPPPLTWAEANAIIDAQRKVKKGYVVRMGYTVRGLERKLQRNLPTHDDRDIKTWRYRVKPIEGQIVDKLTGGYITSYKIKQADGTIFVLDRDEVLEITGKGFDVNLDNAKTPKVYVAELNGQTFTRSSARAYTHAVILENRRTGKLSVGGFNGSRALARKAATQYDQANYQAHIVPVTIKQK